jgi:hypothetical protein
MDTQPEFVGNLSRTLQLLVPCAEHCHCPARKCCAAYDFYPPTGPAQPPRSMAPGQSRPKGPGALTTERLARACAGALAAACDAKWMLVDEAVCAGRLHPLEASGAKFLIARRAARRAGTYKEFHAKLPSSFTYEDPGFYVAAPLPTELIHTIMQFVDGRTLARFSNCSPQLRLRADRIASESLYHMTTLGLGHPAVADWKTELRLLAVLTNPPNFRSLLGPGTAWAPIRDHVKRHWAREILKYAEPETNYNLEDHRACMVKCALRLGDAAVIEGIMRTTDPGPAEERYHHTRNFYDSLDARNLYLSVNRSRTWTARKTISNHFLHVERVQAAAAAGRSIAEYSRLLQLAAAHDRYFPGLDDVVDESDSEPDDDDADDWGYVDAMADY